MLDNNTTSPAPTSTADFNVVWPSSPRVMDAVIPAPRHAGLGGVKVALLWDWLFDGDHAYEHIKDELTRRFPGVTFVGYEQFGNIHGPDELEVIARLPGLLERHGCRAVIAGVGHCGSCAPAVVRAAIVAERAGIPAVAIVSKSYEGQSRSVARMAGMPEAPLAIYPGLIGVDDDGLFEMKIRATVTDAIVAGLTRTVPASRTDPSEPTPRQIVGSGTLEEVNDDFEARHWTDGLPIIPPTIDRVEAFLACTPMNANDVLGILKPDRRQATVWSVAVNGVMAGCRPDYMPVLVAIASAIADPVFRLEDSPSGVGWEPLVTISGPVIEDLEFNYQAGALRVGRRANTSIGRFVRLYMRNVAGLRIPPFNTDRPGLGNSFRVVLAENEKVVRGLGWPTYGEDRGLVVGESGVTVQSVVAESPPINANGKAGDVEAFLEPLVEVFGKAVAGHWLHVGLAFGAWHPMVIINPGFAELLAEQGMSKDDFRSVLFERSRIPARRINERMESFFNVTLEEQVRNGVLPATFAQSDDPDRLIPTFIAPEMTGIVVSGREGAGWQRGLINNHRHGQPVTRRIDLPADWAERMERRPRLSAP